MISQLSLFDMATTEIGSFYTPGDWVKIRKVPTIARHVRCGHVYKIHSVNPTNGLLQFWNPFARQWDFFCPDEVKLAHVPPDKIDDSPTPAEVAVTESNCPYSEAHTTPSFDAVTESIPQHSNDDSVTLAEVAVTESSTPEPDYFSAVSRYKPRGTARGKEYYRLSYKLGGKVRHVHIRGGNTDSPIAQAKVAEVRSLLAAGMTPRQIAAMLQSPNK
jgi:hypothetical protein